MNNLRFLFAGFISIGSVYTVAAQTIVNANDPNIHYMGRTAKSDGATTLTYTASSVIINFNGTGAKATLRDNSASDFITVVVDDKVVNTINPGKDKAEYPLVSGLPIGPHKLELFKRTEFQHGKLFFYNFTLDGKGKILPPPVYNHKIEFYGNSITSGFAIEDPERLDRGTPKYENGYKSYANLTARYFKADNSIVSKSGIGLVVGNTDYNMPDIYDLTDAKDPASKWDFKKYTPDVVVVNLFQNDSFILLNPQNPQFVKRFGSTAPTADFIISAYQKFITSIRGKYPNAKIICALGSMSATKPGSPWPGYIEKAVAGLNDKNVLVHIFAYKNTPRHPNEQEQQAMADDLISFIKQNLNW